MNASALATRLPDTGIGIAGSFIERQLRLGLEYSTAGRIEEAIAAYRSGLAAAEAESPGDVEAISDLHSRLGNACMVRGDLEFAAANFKAALRLAPQLTSCWCNLGNVYLRT